MGKIGKSKYTGYFKAGQIFGNYTIVSGNIIISREAKVECKCKCGRVNLVSCYTLVTGTSKQCLTCGNSMKSDKNPSWKGYGNIPGKILSKLKRDAEIRKLPFEITLEFLDKKFRLQNEKCALSGLDLIFGKNQTASVDRIDSKIGYVENNVQWVHKDINMMKKNYPEDYFRWMCFLVVNKNN